MLFNSFDFLIFLPVVFILYWFFFSKTIVLRNIFLLTVSYIFYAFWDWRFIILIIISSLADFLIGIQLSKTEDHQKRKILLIISLIVNLGILGYFKYYNFFIDSFIDTFSFMGKEFNYSPLNIILPVGISFYTFQSLSYTIDIYYRKFSPTTKIIDFFTFVSFFPQLVAGPIERAKDLLPLFEEKKVFNYDDTRRGLLMIAFGLFKKIVIADRIAIFIDTAYGDISAIEGIPLILAIIFFAFQLYFDFSAYSDIAIGTAKILGFRLSTNFRRPYLSGSFSEFWTRWHISLSSWFRDYVYIPLGGNRKGKTRTMIHVMIVFALSGLWHGASWNFVIWGAINGLFVIILDKLFRMEQSKGIKRIIMPFIVFTCWSLSLVFFRIPDFSDAISIFQHLNFSGKELANGFGLNSSELAFSIYLIIGMMIYELIIEKYGTFLQERFYNTNVVFRWCLYLILVFGIIYLGSYGTANDNSFIYFQF